MVLWFPLVGAKPGLYVTGLAYKWVWCPATLVKTVKVRRGLHDHVGSDRRLVVGLVTPCFMVPRPCAHLLELGVTNQQLVAIDWFTGGSCVVFPGENKHKA